MREDVYKRQILANAGGVVVSYFEWVQNIQSMAWDLDEVNRTLKKIMNKAYDEVDAMSRDNKVTCLLYTSRCV